jgi:hypothetical protein
LPKKGGRNHKEDNTQESGNKEMSEIDSANLESVRKRNGRKKVACSGVPKDVGKKSGRGKSKRRKISNGKT